MYIFNIYIPACINNKFAQRIVQQNRGLAIESTLLPHQLNWLTILNYFNIIKNV